MPTSKTVYFVNHNNLQHMSAIIPIYKYMKKHGYDVCMPPKIYWSESRRITVESTGGGRPLIIYVPHGPARENVDYTCKTAPKCFGVLVPGPIGYEACKKTPYIDRMGNEWKEAPNLRRVKMVGWPKSDLLFSPEKAKVKQEVEDLLKLPYEKTVLLADYREINSLTKITARLKVNLVIKPHIGSQEQKRYSLTKAPHVRWINPSAWDNITRLFLISDVCIVNDWTSVGTEFMVTGKPVLSNGRGYPNKLALSGFFFKEEEYPVLTGFMEKMEENIKRSLDNPDELKALRERWLKRIIYKPDGHASERAAKAIMELVGEK